MAAASAAGDETGLRRATRMGLWLSVAFAVLAMPFFWWSEPILTALGQEAEVAREAAGYLRIAGWGLFPALLAFAAMVPVIGSAAVSIKRDWNSRDFHLSL